MSSKAQIIATIGPASEDTSVLEAMFLHQMDVVRFNFAWSDFQEREKQLGSIRELEKKSGRKIIIIQDLPGPRRTIGVKHSYDSSAEPVLSLQDKSSVAFGAKHGLDWIALSFVGSATEIEVCREEVKKCAGKQKIMAKIEREKALDNLDAIIDTADAVMVARGDLGMEIPIERIPFVQAEIIRKCKTAGKPVVVATEMLLSMVQNERPTRAEVTDVANAIIQGADAVMVSDETSIGAHPVEVIEIMEKIVLEAEQHLPADTVINPL